MLSDLSSSDKGAGALNNLVTSLSGLGAGGGGGAVGGGVSLLHQLNAGSGVGGSQMPMNDGTGFQIGTRGPKNKSGDSDDSSITARLNDASRSVRLEH